MRQVDYRLLGPLEVVVEGEPLPLGRRQQRAVLAILLLHANEAVSTDRLVELLWPERPPTKPQTAVQGYVSALRKVLGRDAIETAGGGYLVRVEPQRLDSERFERLLRDGREALGREHPERAAELLEEALALWRGPPLTEFTYEPWAHAAIGRLEELRVVAGEDLVETRLALGQHAQLCSELEARVEAQPLRERPRAQLMLALYRSGRQAEALEVYQRARATLRDELGIDPSPDLQALYKQILNQDETLELEPRSKAPPTNLPAPPNRLIGRERELAELCLLLRQPNLRFVTLTGPGGTGKTRLAIATAAELVQDQPDGVWLVDLAPLRDARLVVPTIARTLSDRDNAERAFAGKRLLLVLDNFEQILPAAVEVARLLRAESGLKVLATSRELLHLAEEREYPVPPLAEDDAVELFVEHAVEPGLEASEDIAEICRRLDGLPLAIQLAAARTKVLTPAALLSRLSERLPLLTGGPRDVPERQQTLRATIEWSYELLQTHEQRLFANLAVFAGGCSLDAAEEVSGADIDTLESLIDKSLIRRMDERLLGQALADGESRFFMLATIHEYASERLDARPEREDVLRRHAAYYLALAERAEPTITRGGPDQAQWMARLERERDNFRGALQQLAAAEEHELQLRLAAALGPFWFYAGLWAEGQEALERALAATPARTVARVAALYCASGLASVRGEYGIAGEHAREAARLAEKLGDLYWRGRSLARLGRVASETGDTDRAVELCEDALALFRELGDDFGISHAARELGVFALDRHDFSVARRYLEEALASNVARADRLRASTTLVDLGLVALHERRLDDARQRFEASLASSAELHFRDICAWSIEGLGAVEAEVGDAPRAARLLGAAEAIWEEIGGGPSAAEQPLHDRAVQTLHDKLGSERVAKEWAAGRGMRLPEVLSLAAASPNVTVQT